MQLYRIDGTTQFADVYGAGTYGSCDYNSATTCTSTNNGGTLSNTGIAVASFVTLACIIALVAIIVRVWRRQPKKEAVAVTTDEEQSEQNTDQTNQPRDDS